MVNDLKWANQATVSSTKTEDAGLRAYMQGVYSYMAMALSLTGIMAFLVGNSPQLASLFYVLDSQGMNTGMTGLGWICTLLPLGFVVALSFGINRLSLPTTQLIFWGYAATMGISLASIFFTYTGVSITRVFFISASMFGGMSIYGHTTKRDLTGFGSFLIMGLFGILIASIANIFLRSSGLDFAISFIGVLVFTGLAAYDTKRIRSMYYFMAGADSSTMAKVTIQGALQLYLDFINLFISLLRLFGDRRN